MMKGKSSDMGVKEKQKGRSLLLQDGLLLYLQSGAYSPTRYALKLSCRLMLCDPTRVVIEVHSLTSTEVQSRRIRW